MALSNAETTILQFDSVTATCLQISPVGPSAPGEDGVLSTVAEGGLDALKRQTDLAGKTCHSILPRQDVTLRLLTVPTQDADEIAAMVSLSAADWVPYPIEEMQITHQALAALPGGESRVLVVLIRRTLVDDHIAAVRAHALEPVEIYLSTACLVATATMLDETGDVALVYIDATTLELVVVQNSELTFSRGITHSEPWCLDSPQGREVLGYEVRELLAAYRREREDGQGVETLYVSTHGLDVERATAHLEEVTGKPCQVAHTETPRLPDHQHCPAPFAGALQMARGTSPLDLALSPPALGQRQAMRTVQANLVSAAALVAILAAALLLWYAQALWQRHHYIAEIQERIDAVAVSAQGVSAKQHGLQIISRQVDRGGSFLELLAGLASAAPDTDLNITRLQYNREAGMTLWGRARSKDLVLKDFLGGMRKNAEGNLAHFAHAHSLYETAGMERGQPIFNYQVAIPFPEESVDVADAPTP